MLILLLFLKNSVGWSGLSVRVSNLVMHLLFCVFYYEDGREEKLLFPPPLNTSIISLSICYIVDKEPCNIRKEVVWLEQKIGQQNLYAFDMDTKCDTDKLQSELIWIHIPDTFFVCKHLVHFKTLILFETVTVYI